MKQALPERCWDCRWSRRQSIVDGIGLFRTSTGRHMFRKFPELRWPGPWICDFRLESQNSVQSESITQNLNKETWAWTRNPALQQSFPSQLWNFRESISLSLVFPRSKRRRSNCKATENVFWVAICESRTEILVYAVSISSSASIASRNGAL